MKYALLCSIIFNNFMRRTNPYNINATEEVEWHDYQSNFRSRTFNQELPRVECQIPTLHNHIPAVGLGSPRYLQACWWNMTHQLTSNNSEEKWEEKVRKKKSQRLIIDLKWYVIDIPATASSLILAPTSADKARMGRSRNSKTCWKMRRNGWK